jgi:hypothetical protein
MNRTEPSRNAKLQPASWKLDAEMMARQPSME